MSSSLVLLIQCIRARSFLAKHGVLLVIMCLLCACADITCYACHVPTYHITFNTVAGNATCILFVVLYVPAGILECCITCSCYEHMFVSARSYMQKKTLNDDNLNISDNLMPPSVKKNVKTLRFKPHLDVGRTSNPAPDKLS